MITANSATAIFTIRLTGNDIQPDLLAARDLGQLLLAAEQTVLSVVKEQNPDQADEILITLSQVKSESVGLQFSSNHPEIVRRAFNTIVEQVRDGNFSALPGPTLEGLQTFTRFTAERKGFTEFWNGNGNKPLLSLGPEFSSTIPRPSYSRGETVLYGKVERVGGVKPRIKLRISSKTVVYGDVSEEQGRALGAVLYHTVSLRGNATWDIRSGEIVYFRVTQILPHNPGTVRDAFQELRNSTNGAYDNVQDIDLLAFRIREGELP